MRIPVNRFEDVPEAFHKDVIKMNGQWWVEVYPPWFVETKNAVLKSQEAYAGALKNLFNEMLDAQRHGQLLVIFDVNEDLEDPMEWCKHNCRHSFKIIRAKDIQPCALFSDRDDATKFKLFFG